MKTLLLIAVATYFLIEILLINYKELFPGANKIGQFFSKLSISYISAFIFYFIVVHIKNERDRENINEFVGQKVSDILTSAHLFIQPFLQIEDKKASFAHMDIRKLPKLLSSIQRNAKDAPYIIHGENGTWMDWWEYLKGSTFESFNHIYVRYNHIDTKLIKILTRMENSLFFTQWNLLYFNEHDKTFGLYTTQIKMYLEHVKDLQEYSDKHLSGYSSLTSEFMGYKGEY